MSEKLRFPLSQPESGPGPEPGPQPLPAAPGAPAAGGMETPPANSGVEPVDPGSPLAPPLAPELGTGTAETAVPGKETVGSIDVTPDILVTAMVSALEVQSQMARQRAMDEQAVRKAEAGKRAAEIEAAYMEAVARDPKQQKELSEFVNPHYAVKMKRERRAKIAEIDAGNAAIETENAARIEAGLKPKELQAYPDKTLRELATMIKERGVKKGRDNSDESILQAVNAALMDAGLKEIEEIPNDVTGDSPLLRALNAILRARGLAEIDKIPEEELAHADFGKATDEDRKKWGRNADKRAWKSRFGRAALAGVPMAPGMAVYDPLLETTRRSPLDQTKRREVRMAMRAARKSGKKLSIDADMLRYEGEPKTGYQHGGVAIDRATGKSKRRNENPKLRGISRQEKKAIRFGEKRYKKLARKSRNIGRYLMDQERNIVRQRVGESKVLSPVRLVTRGGLKAGKFVGKKAAESARSIREVPAAYRAGRDGLDTSDRFMQRQLDRTARAAGRSVAGFRNAPRAYREGRDGTAVDDGRIQEQLNRAARAAGRQYGKLKNRRSTTEE